MKAELLLRERHQVDSNSFADLRVWRVPERVRASKHDYKYSLAYVVKGECVLRTTTRQVRGIISTSQVKTASTNLLHPKHCWPISGRP